MAFKEDRAQKIRQYSLGKTFDDNDDDDKDDGKRDTDDDDKED